MITPPSQANIELNVENNFTVAGTNSEPEVRLAIEETKPSPMKSQVSLSPDLKFPSLAGKTESDTLVLLPHPKAPLPREEASLLNTILTAASIDPHNIAILYSGAMVGIGWNELAAAYPQIHWLAFGVDSVLLPDGQCEGELYTEGGKRVLRAAALSLLKVSPGAKKQLWQGLKEMYRL